MNPKYSFLRWRNYTPELIHWPVNNTMHPDFPSYPSEILHSIYPPTTTPIRPSHPAIKNSQRHPLPSLPPQSKPFGSVLN